MNRFPRGLGGYCERTIDGLWGEPLNTVSNIAFFIAAFAAWRLWRAQGGGDRFALALVVLTVLIGIGSTAFHAQPGKVTVMMDVVPIQIFILAYLFLAQRRFLDLGPLVSAAGVLLFIALSVLLTRWFGPRFLAGGIGYLPALAALFGFGLVLAALQAPERQAAGRRLILAGGLFAVSLAARTLDRPFCDIWPPGLHMFWHVMNAAVLYTVMRAALLFQAGEADREAVAARP